MNIGEKELCFALRLVIVHREREQVAQFLIKSLFACPNITDTGKKLIEIVRSSIGILEAFVVNEKALLQILAQRRIRPTTELRTTRGTDAKTDGKDCVEIVESCVIFFSVGGSSKEKLYN